MVLILGSYGTFNRVIRKISQTVRLIETVRFFILAWFFNRLYGTFFIISFFTLDYFIFVLFPLAVLISFCTNHYILGLYLSLSMKMIDLKHANSIYNRGITQTVRLIETVQ